MSTIDASYADAAEAATPVAESMRGRVCVITGANRGIGKATALGLAQRGARVVMLVRDPRLGATAREEIVRRSGNPHVSTVTADLASFASIRAAAASITQRFPAVHVLVNNAGVNRPRRSVSVDGFELTFAVNHLAPFLLTHELFLPLREGASDGGARVVTVSSMFERFGRIDFNDLQGSRRYIGLLAYTQSKLANLLFTRELSERLEGTTITANCADPGLVATDLMRDRLWWSPRWLRAIWSTTLLTPEQGALAPLRAAISPALARVSGECIDRQGRIAPTSRRSRDPETMRRLWRISEELTGLGPALARE
jgi:NAD(P)-dependent dehydrogenase (short-subunit alcohol dehydrogenase family)